MLEKYSNESNKNSTEVLSQIKPGSDMSPQRKKTNSITNSTNTNTEHNKATRKKSVCSPFMSDPRKVGNVGLNQYNSRLHKVSLKSSLNERQGNFSKFEINIIENNYGINSPNINNNPSTPSFNLGSSKKENEIQIIFLVHKEDLKSKNST